VRSILAQLNFVPSRRRPTTVDLFRRTEWRTLVIGVATLKYLAFAISDYSWARHSVLCLFPVGYEWGYTFSKLFFLSGFKVLRSISLYLEQSKLLGGVGVRAEMAADTRLPMQVGHALSRALINLFLLQRFQIQRLSGSDRGTRKPLA
jgi:hypothetical protein